MASVRAGPAPDSRGGLLGDFLERRPGALLSDMTDPFGHNPDQRERWGRSVLVRLSQHDIASFQPAVMPSRPRRQTEPKQLPPAPAAVRRHSEYALQKLFLET